MVCDVLRTGHTADHGRQAASREAPQQIAVAAHGGAKPPGKGGADGRDPNGMPAMATNVGAEGGEDGVIEQVVAARIVHDVDHRRVGIAKHRVDDRVDALGQAARP